MISFPLKIDKKCIGRFDNMHKLILMEFILPNQNFEWWEKIIRIDSFLKK